MTKTDQNIRIPLLYFDRRRRSNSVSLLVTSCFHDIKELL